MKIEQGILKWLLEGDPSVKWQVHKDLLDSPPEIYNPIRSQISEVGWGARLLSLQDPSGTWANGLYSPKWISTTYTSLLLIHLGLSPDTPQIQKPCQILLDKGFFHDGGINYFKNLPYSEMCITGMVLKILSYFGYKDSRIHQIVDFILQEQMADGGWNCRKPRGDTHSSFHTTISVLEGLAIYRKNFSSLHKKRIIKIEKASEKAPEFLLQHKLFRSHRTGEIFDKKMTVIHFPPRWHYDFLRILDYFQAIDYPVDSRMEESIELLRKKRKKDGTWNQYSNWAGRVFFELEPVGKPGRFNTLRALRVLKWWDKNKN